MGVFFRITNYFYTNNNYNSVIKLAGKMLCIYLEIQFLYLVSYVMTYFLSKCIVQSGEPIRNSDCTPSKTHDPNVPPAVRIRDRSQIGKRTVYPVNDVTADELNEKGKSRNYGMTSKYETYAKLLK